MDKRRNGIHGLALGLLIGVILSGLRAEPEWIPIGFCLGLALNFWLPDNSTEKSGDDSGKK